MTELRLKYQHAGQPAADLVLTAVLATLLLCVRAARII